MVEEASREPFLVVYATRSSVCRRKKKPIAGEKKTSADAVDDVTQAQLASASPHLMDAGQQRFLAAMQQFMAAAGVAAPLPPPPPLLHLAPPPPQPPPPLPPPLPSLPQATLPRGGPASLRGRPPGRSYNFLRRPY